MVSFAANVRLSPGGFLFILMLSVVGVLYVKNKFPKWTLTAPTDVVRATKLVAQTSVAFRNRSTTISLKRLLAASLDVAEKGGRVLVNVRRKKSLKVKSKGLTAEGVNDPVTDGDLKSHRVMFGSLKQIWPNLRVISEEKDNQHVQNNESVNKVNFHYLQNALQRYRDEIVNINDVTVWIDPLDATQEYTENLVRYVTTMVCIAVKGVPIAGVIHQPFIGYTYWGWVNHGHSEMKETKDNGKKIRIIVSRSHAGSVNITAKKVFHDSYTVISAGGAGYKSLAIALGQADVYIHVTAIKKWDICAGNAILNALGGNMTDLSGNLVDYSKTSVVKLKAGLLASLKNHPTYINRFRDSKGSMQ